MTKVVHPKNIVLCSDGTGNSGGYGADSNVYKTYKAVDVNTLGQYTFYGQGIGTEKSVNSKNKYWTAVSGAFGFGFRDNVLNLYHFLARTYVPGDAIFLFGFSRGAATVRALTGFINACGLLDTKHKSVQTDDNFDPELFQKKVEEAFDLYRKRDENEPERLIFKKEYAVHHNDHAPDGNLKIKFIGVWDTVSALGFPRNFSKYSKWFFDLVECLIELVPCWAYKFYDYKLNNSIENAYHALSIDDERKSFLPMVWNEYQKVCPYNKPDNKPEKKHFDGHVEQVWFAGVHSNVGGGYPRTGLSDVALQWMLTKATAHGLVFHPDHITAIQNSANIYDKLYDSRDGIGIYYRYGPRDLTALCDGQLKGKIAIHISAYKKIKEKSDTYAPDGIPGEFDVVEYDPADKAFSIVECQVSVANLPDPAKKEWAEQETKMKEIIKKRKMLYCTVVLLTVVILLVSGYFWGHPPESVTELNACEVKHIQIVQSPANEKASDIKTLAANPFYVYEQNASLTSNSNATPDFCKKANNRSLKGFADILRYLTPVYFENFITLVVEAYWWIFFGIMIPILVVLFNWRKKLINDLDKVCRKMCDLLPDRQD